MHSQNSPQTKQLPSPEIEHDSKGENSRQSEEQLSSSQSFVGSQSEKEHLSQSSLSSQSILSTDSSNESNQFLMTSNNHSLSTEQHHRESSSQQPFPPSNHSLPAFPCKEASSQNHSSPRTGPFSLSQTSTISSSGGNGGIGASNSSSSSAFSPFHINFSQIPLFPRSESSSPKDHHSQPSISFVICDSPDDERMSDYIRLFREKGVTDVVRVCKPRYDAEALQNAQIQVHEFYFEDGGVPPESLLASWLQLVRARISNEPKAIAVHCVAGLGRAPLLVAVALMEFGGLSALDAIELIRSKRRGSLNSRQIRYLVDVYVPGAAASGSGGAGGSRVNNSSIAQSISAASKSSASGGTGEHGKGGFLRKLIGRLF